MDAVSRSASAGGLQGGLDLVVRGKVDAYANPASQEVAQGARQTEA